MKPLFALFAFVALMLLMAACTPQLASGTQMAEANRLYEAGQFAEAAAAYQALVDTGVEDGALYYNLGNAYLKANDLGRAVLNYRRAQQLLPHDPDVAANLRLARAQTRDQLEEADGGLLAGSVRRFLVEWTTLEEAAVIALGLWVVLCALVVVAILWPRGRPGLRYAISVTAVLLGLSLLSAGIRVADVPGRVPAVIVAESIEVHSGPGTDYLTEFTLHAGAEVRLVEQRNDWVRIVLPGDLQGWAPSKAVERIGR